MSEVIHKIKNLSSLARLNKPIGSFLLLWPTLWALWIAASGLPKVRLLVVFIFGVIIMRSAGCVINDIADRKFDGAVERTKNRPLVLKTVSISEALLFFFGLCSLGLILVLQLNEYTIMLSFVALVLAIIYPFTKRITYFPQVILGAAFAWSVPMAFAATSDVIPPIAWLLYVIAALWPVAYDSIYALIDKEDDLKIGIKSTAILFGDWDVMIIFLLQLFIITSLGLLGFFLKFNLIFYLSLFVAMVLVCYQLFLIRKRTRESYYRAFYNNHWLGLTVFLGITFNYL